MTVGHKRSLYNGTCTAILRAKKGEKGIVVLTASAPGMNPVKIKLQTL